MIALPDILWQLIACGLLFFAVVYALVLIVPMLTQPSKPKAPGDAKQELCRECGYDARGLLICPECGKSTLEARRQRLAKLRDAWPTESIAVRVPGATEQPISILTTDDGWAARLLRQHLEARGIAASVNELDGPALVAYTAAVRSYRLCVWSDDLQRATAIVQHLWPQEARIRDPV